MLNSVEDDLSVFQAGATDSVMLRQFLTRVLWRECFKKDLSFLFAHPVIFCLVLQPFALQFYCGALLWNLELVLYQSWWYMWYTIIHGIRPERCIVTIASLDQWLATIEKHRHQWLAD